MPSPCLNELQGPWLRKWQWAAPMPSLVTNGSNQRINSAAHRNRYAGVWTTPTLQHPAYPILCITVILPYQLLHWRTLGRQMISEYSNKPKPTIPQKSYFEHTYKQQGNWEENPMPSPWTGKPDIIPGQDAIKGKNNCSSTSGWPSTIRLSLKRANCWAMWMESQKFLKPKTLLMSPIVFLLLVARAQDNKRQLEGLDTWDWKTSAAMASQQKALSYIRSADLDR